MNGKRFSLAVADEPTAVMISQLKSSADDMTSFLNELSPQQMEQLILDKDGLQALYAALLEIKDRPGKVYTAQTDNGNLIGYVTVKGYGREDPELQIEIMPEYQRQGYGRELLSLVIQEIFRKTTAEKVTYRTGLYNAASMKLIESLGGFLQEPSSIAEEMLLRTYYIKADFFASVLRNA